MSKSLREQIENRCVHFTGVQYDCCREGIRYVDVRVGRPYQFPCLKTGGTCAKCRFPTEEEIIAEIEEIEQLVEETLSNIKPPPIGGG